MMRRLLAAVAAILLMISPAMADQSLRVSFEADPEEMGDGLIAGGMPEDAAVPAASWVCGLLSRLEMKAVRSEGTLSLDASLEGHPLADMRLFTENGAWYVQSSLLPGISCHVPVETVRQSLQELRGMLLLDGAKEEKGRFWGYAFQEGDTRRTRDYSQKDMVAWLEGIVEQARPQLNALGLGDAADAFLASEREAAGQERYTLHLASVLFRGKLSGCTMTLMDRENPVMTLSLGFPEDGFRAAFGAGLFGAAYYADLTFRSGGTEEGQADMAAVHLYRDSDALGYEAIEGQHAGLGGASFSLVKPAFPDLSGMAWTLKADFGGQTVLVQDTADAQKDAAKVLTRTNEGAAPFLTVCLASEIRDELHTEYAVADSRVVSWENLPETAGDLGEAVQSGMRIMAGQMMVIFLQLLQE